MLTKANLKKYQQLRLKKFRQKYGLFVVEGLKSVKELLNSDWPIETVICNDSFDLSSLNPTETKINRIEDNDFNKVSQLSNSQGILAIAKIKSRDLDPTSWSLALDGINDPGNLGTIIRVADWYGINTIYCSENTVDLFNSKTISASMGSFLRTQIIKGNLSDLLKDKRVYATLLEGDNVREIQQKDGGIILIGNEANGISSDILNEVEHVAISIPGNSQTESLNAAIATAICCERLVT